MESSDISSREFYRHLEATSRAFYLSLRFLPGPTRTPIALAYALARTADSLADQFDLPAARRREALRRFAAALDEPAAAPGLVADLAPGLTDPRERALLEFLPANLRLLAGLADGDRRRIGDVLATIVGGMVTDLDTEGGPLAALATRADLEGYTYAVAGVVGEFWTRTASAHLSGWARAGADEMESRGVRFGRGLQLTNILRDLPRDLAGGRCYLPAADLAALGLAPADLLDPAAIDAVRPLLDDLLAEAVGHYNAGIAYTLAIAPPQLALRASCAMPLLIGLETLALLAAADDLLDPGVVYKVPRRRVWRLAGRTLFLARSDRGLAGLFRRALAGLDRPAPAATAR